MECWLLSRMQRLSGPAYGHKQRCLGSIVLLSIDYYSCSTHAHQPIYLGPVAKGCHRAGKYRWKKTRESKPNKISQDRRAEMGLFLMLGKQLRYILDTLLFDLVAGCLLARRERVTENGVAVGRRVRSRRCERAKEKLPTGSPPAR